MCKNTSRLKTHQLNFNVLWNTRKFLSNDTIKTYHVYERVMIKNLVPIKIQCLAENT